MPVEPLLLFQICAGIGSGILLIQLMLQLTGAGDVDDFDVDGGNLDAGDHDFQWLSLRTICAFLAIFGLVGWWGTADAWGGPRTLAASSAAGLATMLIVAYLLSLQRKLNSQGNVNAENVIGLAARVYLRIPSAREGMGKITVLVQDRSMEYGAVTGGAELPTGAQVRVVRMISANTFEVEPLD